MKKENPFKILKNAIERAEKEWQKDIENTENPLLKMIKQDYKDLIEIESKFWLLKEKYGIEVRLVYPGKPKGNFWGKGIAEKSLPKIIKEI